MAFLAKLRPMGQWRAGPDTGERSRAAAILHSDALFSALSHAMSQLGLLDAWLAATAANPLGVKGSGQAGCIGAPQTVMAAILDALRPAGVQQLEMPATPARVWEALQRVRS